MHQGARDRDLHLLALREALRAPVGDRVEAKRVEQRVGACLERGTCETVQRAVVADVLARRESRIQAARIGQHADPLADRVAVATDVEPPDRRATGLGHH